MNINIVNGRLCHDQITVQNKHVIDQFVYFVLLYEKVKFLFFRQDVTRFI